VIGANVVIYAITDSGKRFRFDMVLRRISMANFAADFSGRDAIRLIASYMGYFSKDNDAPNQVEEKTEYLFLLKSDSQLVHPSSRMSRRLLLETHDR